MVLSRALTPGFDPSPPKWLTLYPIDEALDDDEAAELLPWPEGAAEPVMIDRFDARLLLDPLELALSQRSSAAAARMDPKLELE